MRAVLIATGYYPEMDPLIHYRPTPLLHIADKPILYYIFEFLARQGIKKCDLVLHHHPEMIEDKTGEGKRWGLTVAYHLAKEGNHPFTALRPVVQGWDDEMILLGMGDTLPEFGEHALDSKNSEASTLLLFPSKEWSQWALIPSKVLASVPSNTLLKELPDLLKNHRTASVRPSLSTQSLEELKKTNQKIVADKPSYYLFPNTARMVEQEIWISRAVSLHPTAKIIPPVFLGESCQVQAGAQIGPYAVIENNCIIDRRSIIHHTLVCQHSYIGEGLDIHNSIVDRNLLINLRLDTNISVHDDFILSELSPPSFKKYPIMFLERLLTLFLFVLTLPLYPFLFLSSTIRRDPMLHLPAPDSQHDWKTFNWLSFELKPGAKSGAFQSFCKRLPTLVNILRGDTHIVGVSPRSIKDVNKLPPDWQKLYLKSKIGLITLSDLDNGPGASGDADSTYASEVFYSVHMGFWYDLKLILRWKLKKLRALKESLINAWERITKRKHHAA